MNFISNLFKSHLGFISIWRDTLKMPETGFSVFIPVTLHIFYKFYVCCKGRFSISFRSLQNLLLTTSERSQEIRLKMNNSQYKSVCQSAVRNNSTGIAMYIISLPMKSLGISALCHLDWIMEQNGINNLSSIFVSYL